MMRTRERDTRGRVRRAVTLAVLALGLAGCAATPDVSVEPLALGSRYPVDYRANLTSGFEFEPEIAVDDAGVKIREDTRAVQVTCRMVGVSEEVARQAIKASPSGFFSASADQRHVERMLGELVGQSAANILTAPQLCVYTGQRATVSVIDQVSYVSDFEIEATEDALIADPVISVVQDGMVLDLTPTLSEDGASTHIEVTLILSDLQHPLTELSTRLPGAPQDVTIQLPVVKTQKLTTEADLDAGSTLVLGHLRQAGTDEVILVFLDAEMTDSPPMGGEELGAEDERTPFGLGDV